MFERYLYSHYELSVLRANVQESEGQHLQRVYSPAYRFGGPGRFAFSREMRAELAGLSDHADCRRRIMVDWQDYVVGDSGTLLEKSPPNLTKIDWLRKVFPGSSFVVFVRDPRAVSAATRKWAKTSLEALMLHWNVAHSVAVSEFGDDCFVVRYEDFCADPQGAMEQSGLAGILRGRAAPIEIDGRFSKLRNTNDKYLSQHSCRYYGEGVWRRFGYDV